jgi:hypothetical protein
MRWGLRVLHLSYPSHLRLRPLTYPTPESGRSNPSQRHDTRNVGATPTLPSAESRSKLVTGGSAIGAWQVRVKSCEGQGAVER